MRFKIIRKTPSDIYVNLKKNINDVIKITKKILKRIVFVTILKKIIAIYRQILG